MKYIVYHSIIIDVEGNTHIKGSEVEAELLTLPRMVDVGAVYPVGGQPPEGVDVNIKPMTPGVQVFPTADAAPPPAVTPPAGKKKAQPPTE